jgi:hypothetical protein
MLPIPLVIDPAELNRPIEFSEAVTFIRTTFKRREGAKPLNIATVYRWCQRGLGGHRLEHWQVGRTKFTSKAAILDFFERSAGGGGGAASAPVNDGDGPAPAHLSPALPVTRKRRADAAMSELERLGV